MRVDPARDVDVRTGIGVLEPRPTRPGVLLDDRERHAGGLESNGRVDSREAGPDHDDVKRAELLRVRLLAPLQAARRRIEREFLDPKADVIVRNGLANSATNCLADWLTSRSCR